jgi:hypothetical protein
MPSSTRGEGRPNSSPEASTCRPHAWCAINRASEFGVLSTAQIERVLGFTIAYSVTSDYRTVASAVNAGVPVSSLRESALQRQLATIAHALAEHEFRADHISVERTLPSLLL